MSFASLVRQRGYRDLLVGQGVSALGDWMGTVALMALVLRLTNSPAAVGGILTLRLLPAAVGGPLAARAAAHWDRRRTMLAMDATRAVMIAAVPFVRALWWIYLWGFLIEVASIVFLPARDASIPDLVGDVSELPLANGLILGSSYGSIPLGAGLFAAVAALPITLDHRPFALVFFLDAVSFLVSFACISRLTQLGPTHERADEVDGSKLRFRDAFSIPLVSAVMPAALSVSLGLGALLARHRVRTRRAARVGRGVRSAHRVVRRRGSDRARDPAAHAAGRSSHPYPSRRRGDRRHRRRLQPCSDLVGRVLRRDRIRRGRRILARSRHGCAPVAARRPSARPRVHCVPCRSAGRVGSVGDRRRCRGDLLGSVRWPVVGELEPSRLVLLAAGLFVLCSATLVRVREPRRHQPHRGPSAE